MIVVLADDLTGAAELAGTAWKRGLTAEVQREFSANSSAQVLCVDTDTRSLSKAEAERVVRGIAAQVAASRPDHLYKKCDSVLRGHVLTEIGAIIEVTQRSQAMLVSANPSRGRVIRGGEYFVQGKRLAETAFANDPEYPRRTSDVRALLDGDLTGVTVPDAETKDDLERHAREVGMDVLPAGGVEFFESLLETQWAQNRTVRQMSGPVPSTSPTLFVCGSAAAWGSGREGQCAKRKVQVVPMPAGLLAGRGDEEEITTWAGRVRECFKQESKVMIAIAQPTMQTAFPASWLAEQLAESAAQVLRQGTVRRICAEGGATAAALASTMGWSRFEITEELAGGVVALRPVNAPEFSLIIKVGSYDWPEAVW